MPSWGEGVGAGVCVRAGPHVCAHAGPKDACASTSSMGWSLQAPGHPVHCSQEGVSEPRWTCSALLHWNPSFQSAAQGQLHGDSPALSRSSNHPPNGPPDPSSCLCECPHGTMAQLEAPHPSPPRNPQPEPAPPPRLLGMPSHTLTSRAVPDTTEPPSR